ncbi:glycosyl transferase family 2 [Brevibacillus parabrevis]|uniref:glycosyltransferase family 2 protein n=1 Tax=Brevibacillus parabrevis TaxID=54914 RepID=UPI0007AB957B|nr:glycosyltransferase [Brevibacillus parabrevis]KZE54633.1 glycosyl transferase family 2 [Brevibacillus parabrevis]
MSVEQPPLVSIIIPVKNEGDNVRTTITSLVNARTNMTYEVIVVDDASTDNGCHFLRNQENPSNIKLITTEGIGAAAARNLGVDHAQGRFLIFCDAHLAFENFWIDRMLELILTKKADGVAPGIASMTEPHKIGYGQKLDQKLGVVWYPKPQRPAPIAILPGGCFIVTREAFMKVGGFDRGFRVWGFEDIEFSIKMWLFGFTCFVHPSVKIRHLFRQTHPYTVVHEHIYYNMLRMAYSHFSEQRIEATKQLIVYANASEIEDDVLTSGAAAQRIRYLAQRKRDDNWFFQQFQIPF